MIERYVYVRLNPEFQTVEGRAEVAAHTRSALGRLSRQRGVRVGVPSDDHSAAGWDLSIVVRFDSMEDLAAYLPDPDHRVYVDDYLKPKMVMLKAWNFEVEEA